MFTIEKKFKFEAGHKLHHLNYDSPCKNFHGHSYTIKVEIAALGINEDYMILDFNKFKSFKDYLDKEWDHAILVSNDENINDIQKVFPNTKIKVVESMTNKSFSSTTSETIAYVLAHELIYKFLELKPHQYEYLKVSVGETENNTATFTIHSTNQNVSFH